MDSIAGSIRSGVSSALAGVAKIPGGAQGAKSPNNSNQGFIQMRLAPSYGTLTNEALKKMDDNTKVMIGTTITILKSMTDEQRTWDNVVSRMKSNTLLESVDGGGTHRSDQLTKSGSHDFKFDGSPDQGTVREIVTWFRKLISDEDILNTMNINIEQLAKVVAQTGATVTGVDSFFGKDQDEHKTVLDIGALRYPDPSNPYFKVYRIKLNAWSHSHRVLFHQEDSNGIYGDFNCCKFQPRATVIATLKQEVRQIAIHTAEDLFQ